MTVKIYSTPSCVYCVKAKDFFKKNNIAYSELNIVEDIVAQAEMIDKTGQLGVPVIEIDGNTYVGFNENKLRGVLKI